MTTKEQITTLTDRALSLPVGTARTDIWIEVKRLQAERTIETKARLIYLEQRRNKK